MKAETRGICQDCEKGYEVGDPIVHFRFHPKANIPPHSCHQSCIRNRSTRKRRPQFKKGNKECPS